MKSVKIFASIIIAAVIMISCKSKTPQELIVNKWQVSDIMNSSGEQMPDSLKAEAKKAVMEFTADNKFHLTGSPSAFDGSYTTAKDGKTLVLTPTDGRNAETDSIKELTADKLVVIDGGGAKVTCISKK